MKVNLRYKNMQRKTTKPAARAKKSAARRCFYCEKRFRNSQGVRAHQLHCEIRRQKAQAESALRPEPEGRSSSHHDSHSRPGPDSQEMKLLLLDAHEAITELQRDTGSHAWTAQWLARTAPTHAQGHTTPEEWLKLYQDLGDIERDIDQLVAVLRLNRTVLF